jgi:integrase/recombinase XerD
MITSAKAFIEQCRDRDYAESTITNHNNALGAFSEWINTHNQPIAECGSTEIEEFLQWVKHRRTIPYGDIRSETFASLQKYFDYLVETGEIAQNPCEDIDVVECIIVDEASRCLHRIRATKAEGTVANRELGLIQFTEWIENEVSHGLEDCTPLDLEDYAIYLKEKGYGDTTVKDRFAAVSTLYEFLHEKVGVLEENPAEDVNLNQAGIVDYRNPTKKSSKLAEDIPYVTKEQKEAMRENCPGPKLRNELLIEFLWQTGLRRQEAADVVIDNIDFEDREIKIRGKNDKSRTVFYQPSLDTLLDLWINGGYRNSYNSAETSDNLFISERSGRLNPHQINQVVVKSAKNAGIQSEMYTDGNGQTRHKITAHSLRHGFAVQSLKNGLDIKTLADIMGHESLDTTKQYLRLITDDLRKRYRKFGPEGTE